MSDKIIKSGITKWDIENIEKVPACMGVFIVRSSPIDDYIIAIEKTEDIKRSLMTIYNEQIYPNVNFFDWYQTENMIDAETLLRDLRNKYNLAHN